MVITNGIKEYCKQTDYLCGSIMNQILWGHCLIILNS